MEPNPATTLGVIVLDGVPHALTALPLDDDPRDLVEGDGAWCDADYLYELARQGRDRLGRAYARAVDECDLALLELSETAKIGAPTIAKRHGEGRTPVSGRLARARGLVGSRWRGGRRKPSAFDAED